VSRQALWPTQPPIQWVPEVKRPGHEADYSPPSSAEVSNAWSYTSIPPLRLHGVVFILSTGNIIFAFIFTPRSSKSSLPYRFSEKNIVCIAHLFNPCYMPANLILLVFITLIFGKFYNLLISSLCSLLQHFFPPT